MARTNERVFLVAHDFSSYAERAADFALDDLLDSRRGGRLVLVHVFQVTQPPPSFEFSAVPGLVGLERDARADATHALERIAERLRKRERLLHDGAAPVQIEATVRLGAPAEALVEEADARCADRLFIGTHGRTGLAHALLGSVAERLARTARIPVVVVHGTRADADRAAPDEDAAERAA